MFHCPHKRIKDYTVKHIYNKDYNIMLPNYYEIRFYKSKEGKVMNKIVCYCNKCI